MVTKLYDFELWISITLGIISGWLCLLFVQIAACQVKKISKNTNPIRKNIIAMFLRILMPIMVSFFIGIIPIAVLPHGEIYRYYLGIYLIAFTVGVLIRMPKFRAEQRKGC